MRMVPFACSGDRWQRWWGGAFAPVFSLGLLLKLVGRVEGGHGDIDDFQVADGAVDAAWADHDGGEGFEGDNFAIGFEVALAFEDNVNLGHAFVMMGSAVSVDVGEVDGSWGVWHFCEGASGFAARAGDGGERIELGDVEAFHGFWKRRGNWSGASSSRWKMKLLE
jgi:hypothetical protein